MVWQRATDTVDFEIRIEVHMIKILRDFLCFHDKKKYNHAQVYFDFGQVYIVWWLSYSQVGQKLSVEPWCMHN